MRRIPSSIVLAALLARAAAPGAAAGEEAPRSIGEAPALTGEALHAAVEEYLRPYVETANFSGAVLIGHRGRKLLSAAWGMANLEHRVANTPRTVFHLASVSRVFTCAAVQLLAQRGRLDVSDPLAKHLPAYPEGDRITIHHLLTGSSGIPDINSLDGYADWSREPQTPETLVARFRDLPLEFEPGERSVHSNSNYVVLALLIERLSGSSYGDFLHDELFAPLGMEQTAHDGDPARIVPHRAAGYVPHGPAELLNAPALDWSVKTGNGSLYSTIEDLWRWDRGLDAGTVLGPRAVEAAFTDYLDSNGYGWFVRERFGTREVHINGRSPGFGSYYGRSLGNRLTVIVLGNLYNSEPTTIGRDLMAMVLGEPFEKRSFSAERPAPALVREVVGAYRFGSDFYVPDRRALVVEDDGHLYIDWDGDELTAADRGWLMPVGEGRFVDRLYGGEVEFRRDDTSAVIEIRYGDFGGRRVDGGSP